MEKPRYEWVDALKGVAIFLVVLGHSIIEYPINLHENYVCKVIFTRLSFVHMPIFFIVSGFCFSYKGNYGSYLLKKVKRLLVPYLAFGILDMIPRFLFPSLLNRPRGLSESIESILLYGGEYWFLYTLFLIFMIYPFIYKISSGKPILLFSTFVILYLINVFFPCKVSIFTLSRILDYICYFSLGVFLRSVYRFAEGKTLKPWASFLLFGILIVSYESLMFHKYFKFYTILIGVAALYFLCCTPFAANIFKRFGKYSLQIYLLNGFLLVISRTTIISLLGCTEPVAIIAFNMFVDFFLSYLFIKYICAKIKPVRFIMGIE